jgi:hypothetical protein
MSSDYDDSHITSRLPHLGLILHWNQVKFGAHLVLDKTGDCEYGIFERPFWGTSILAIAAKE